MSQLLFESYSSINEHLKKLSFSSLFVLVDSHTEEYCYPLLKSNLPDHSLITVSYGEKNKTLESCSFIWDHLSEHHADRHALLINLGGGVITDMGGFCASTYKRGISFINIPTTLLSQTDASAGGKTGIDFRKFKNQIGVFSEPEFVLIDNSFHQTLPIRELRSGFAEMLKHGLIKDKKHWHELIAEGYEGVKLETIKHSIAIKQAVVEEDPYEKGLRKILNFGHTIGHAIESCLLGTTDELLHGEAIAIGMVAEGHIAFQLNLISKSDFKEIKESIERYYGKPSINKALRPEILRLCKQDKKNDRGIIQMSLLDEIGKANYNISVQEELIDQAIEACL